MAARPLPAVPRSQTARLVLGTGFFLTTFLFLFSLLGPDRGNTVFFAVAAGAFLLLLARPFSPRNLD